MNEFRIPAIPNRMRVISAFTGIIFVAISVWLSIFIGVSTEDQGNGNVQTTSVLPTDTQSLPTLTISAIHPTLTRKPDETMTPSPTSIIDVIEMVRVPAGPYKMGSSYWQDEERDFAPSHNIFISEFYIDKYEVTNVQYSECVNIGVCSPPRLSGSNTREHYYDNLEIYGNFPVINVTWEDADSFCKWETHDFQLKPNGKR